MSSLSESCSCGASLALNGGKYGSTVILNYQAEDFRKAHAPCRLPTVGRCGAEPPTVGVDPVARFCMLPHGHEGWHHADDGMDWTAEPEVVEPCGDEYLTPDEPLQCDLPYGHEGAHSAVAISETRMGWRDERTATSDGSQPTDAVEPHPSGSTDPGAETS